MGPRIPEMAGLEGRALADNASKKLIAYHEAGACGCFLLQPNMAGETSPNDPNDSEYIDLS